MAELHAALRTLAPVDFTTVPLDDLATYLTEAFSKGQVLVDSIPIPAPKDEASTTRPRSSTTSSIASSASEMALSSHRISAPASPVEALQKQWGKPVKLNAKENPLGINVYKLGAKDGNGTWFARRSVHEGLGFTRWKKALERELLETTKVQGKPGEGNIRGIGGERVVEYREVEGVGTLAVFHLSAQFPGPTAPRDFVTMTLSSDSALDEKSAGVDDNEIPRHYMLISKPCIHPECPEREGYVRGQYESIEFIREIPIKKPPKRAQSTDDLPTQARKRLDDTDLGKAAVLNSAEKVSSLEVPSQSEGISRSDSGRRRGKTISFAESRGAEAKGEHTDFPDFQEDENPVEWIMITRSDPGGSVPRFMVERGTPGAVVSDASKFLDWACKYKVPETEDGEREKLPIIEVEEMAQAKSVDREASGSGSSQDSASSSKDALEMRISDQAQGESTSIPISRQLSSTSVTTTGSFESAEEMLTDDSVSVDNNAETEKEKDESEPASANKSLTATESEIIKAEEKYLEESRKREEKHHKDLSRLVAKVAARHDKEARKAEKEALKRRKNEERARRKEAEKREKEDRKRSQNQIQGQGQNQSKSADSLPNAATVTPGSTLSQASDKEKDARILEMQRDLTALKLQNDLLMTQVGQLQRENTSFTAHIGRILKPEDGQRILSAVREDMAQTRAGTLGVPGPKTASKAASIKSTASSEQKPSLTDGDGEKVVPLGA